MRKIEVILILIVIFGCTAKAWRQMNPELKGNIRDHATALELLVLSNMEVLNARLLGEKLGKEERFIQLQATAVHQFSVLAHTPSVKRLEDKKWG